jgi:predicted transcriptional regulator with HTH domain
MVEERRLSKRGYVSQTPEGELLLVNENGEAYMVNEAVVAVWDLFNDKTVSDVVSEIASQISRDPSEIRDSIEQLAGTLLEAGLIA